LLCLHLYAMAERSLFDRELHPLKQAGAFLAFLFIVVSIVHLTQNDSSETVDRMISWKLSLSLLLAFAIFNSVMSLPYKNQNDYWFYSTIAFVLVGGGGILISYLYAGIDSHEISVYKWLYIVFTFVYLVLLSIVRAMRKIVEIAQKQDARLRGEDDFIQ